MYGNETPKKQEKNLRPDGAVEFVLSVVYGSQEHGFKNADEMAKAGIVKSNNKMG